MEATDERTTVVKGENQSQQLAAPMVAQAALPQMPGISDLTQPSKIWTPPSTKSSDTETYRNWGINE